MGTLINGLAVAFKVAQIGAAVASFAVAAAVRGSSGKALLGIGAATAAAAVIGGLAKALP